MGNAALVALVAVVPLVVLTLTSFVKISVVLSLVRNAIGAPDAPSGLVVTGLSLVLTFFVMAPVAIDMVHAAATSPSPAPAPAPAPTPTPTPSPNPTTPAPEPSGASRDLDRAIHELVPEQYHPQVDAVERGLGPLREFLAKHASERDRSTFGELAKRMGRDVHGDEMWVLAPAFITSELRAAFAMAVLIFLPFLIIDLVVGLSLAALGLASTSTQNVALPLKLLLFVAVDGWRLLVDALLRGYA